MTMQPVDWGASELDLEAYLRRIGDAGELAPTSAVLARLHQAHASTIPFENLDPLRGLPVRIDLASIQAKLIGAGRGGYCYENNSLFAAVLERAGFGVARLGARVRWRASIPMPRTHMTLRVETDCGRRWLADVGFGAEGLLLPIAFPGAGESETISEQFAWTYRLAREGAGWLLQIARGGGWDDLYFFTEEPQVPADYEVANWYVSTHPKSRFTRTLTAQRLSPERRWMLIGRELHEDTGPGYTTRPIQTDAELLAVLAETFGLRLPEGTRFEMQEI